VDERSILQIYAVFFLETTYDSFINLNKL